MRFFPEIYFVPVGIFEMDEVSGFAANDTSLYIDTMSSESRHYLLNRDINVQTKNDGTFCSWVRILGRSWVNADRKTLASTNRRPIVPEAVCKLEPEDFGVKRIELSMLATMMVALPPEIMMDILLKESCTL
jgi:hypothetical protein